MENEKKSPQKSPKKKSNKNEKKYIINEDFAAGDEGYQEKGQYVIKIFEIDQTHSDLFCNLCAELGIFTIRNKTNYILFEIPVRSYIKLDPLFINHECLYSPDDEIIGLKNLEDLPKEYRFELYPFGF